MSDANRSDRPSIGLAWRRLLDFLGGISATGLTLAGLGIFVVVRLSLVLFYKGFGVSPDEVGYDYLKTLAQSFYGLAFLISLLVVLFGSVLVAQGFYVVTGTIVFRLFTRWRREAPEPEELLDHMRGLLGGFSATFRRWKGILAVGCFFAAAIYLSLAFVDGKDALNGEGTSPYTGGSFPIFVWRAEPAVITSVAESTNPQLNGACDLFLGQADGVTVLYDVSEATTLRIPTSAIMIRVTPSSPETCTPT